MARLSARSASGLLFLAMVVLFTQPAQAGSGITGYRWWPMGPAPAPGLSPGDSGGRATSIAVNPFNKNDVWIGTAGGGVWHHDPVRNVWYAMSDNTESLAIGSIAVAGCGPSQCTTIYAGTGENAFRRDTYYGAGLLIGTFDGSMVAWQPIINAVGPLINGKPTYSFAHSSIYNVVLDTDSSDAVQAIYITVSSGNTASSSESTVQAPSPWPGCCYGIYKSTDNGGSWNKLNVDNLPNVRPSDLEMDPNHHNVLYAGYPGFGIFRSSDSGNSWCPLNPGFPRPASCVNNNKNVGIGLPNIMPVSNGPAFDHVQIALDPTSGQTQLHLFASFGMCPDLWDADCAPGIYESQDGGDSWSTLFPGDETPVQDINDPVPPCPYGYSRYTHGLTVNPNDRSAVIVGAVHLCKYDKTQTFDNKFVTTDHDTIAPLVDQSNNPLQVTYIHLDHHAEVFAPSDHQTVYDANDGGIAISTDGGVNWTPWVKGLGAMEFQSISMSDQTTDVMGGLQDNGAAEWTGAMQWKRFLGPGDGGFSIMMRHTPITPGRYVTTNPKIYNDLNMHPMRTFDQSNVVMSDYNDPPFYDLTLSGSGDRRSFYPPYIGMVANQLFGTQRVWMSSDEATSWTPVSPFLVNNNSLAGAFPGSGTFPGTDSITAMTFHPFDPAHVYVGTYTGKLFTNLSFPCATVACWPSGWATSLPPASPITRLAVEPFLTGSDTVYATLSGFFPGTHVYKSTDSGQTWSQQAAHPGLDGEPVNTISIDPSAKTNLWIGTDHGVYRSDNSGSSWYPFSVGLPNVPVYELQIDTLNDRVIAATHGRGAWILTTPKINTQVYPRPNSLHTLLATNGIGFGPGQRCSARIVRQDGSLCASGVTDALGGTLATDANGFLVSSKDGVFSDLPLPSLCAQGRCLGGDGSACNLPGNPPANLEVVCGSQQATIPIPAAADAAGPPTSRVRVAGLQNGAAGTLQFLPALQATGGSGRLLCSVSVPYGGSDSAADVLQHASDALSADAACQAAGLTPRFLPPVTPQGGEDQIPQPASLALDASSASGQALIPGIAAAPGQANGLCLVVNDLDQPAASRLTGVRVRFTTPPGGASGGSLTLEEDSGLGECTIRVPLAAGAQPSDIASAVAAAFQAPGIPGPNPNCPSDVNPRDLTSQGDSVMVALASDLTLCVNDVTVGEAIVPQEICFANADCDDHNPCTADTCNPTTGQCQSTPLPDGTACEDGNACTVGNTCQAGTCGTPVVCNDGNMCTSDHCDPATGACVFQPITCDDGNACTTDFCDASSGQCTHTSLPDGSACNDGDLCTTGDTCTTIPGSTVPVCSGQAKCADADPCTADVCDPNTGACSNPPLQCDDGNPCTVDMCQAGACTYTPISGVSCDDGNRCTTGDTCIAGPAGPVCSGTPIGCDDGNACTVDSCDQTTGACQHTPIGVSPVPDPLQFTSQMSFNWPAVSGASFYNSYRGTIPQHMMGSRLPAGAVYDQVCFEYGDANGDGAQISNDPGIPPVGTGFYYLVSEETACGEGSIGSDMNTTPIPNTAPCSSAESPVLNIIKTHSGNFLQGQQGATYTLVVANSGTAPTFGTVTVTDMVPSGLTLVSMAGPGWNCPPSPGDTCTRGDALPGGAAYPPITVTVNVAASATSPQVNQAEVSGGGSAFASTSDSTIITQLAPALSITKSHTGHFYRGETGATYTVSVSNTGNAPTSGTVTVTDNAPVGLVNVSVSGTGWTCPTPGSTCTRSDALAPGGSYPDLTVSVDVAPDAPIPSLTNQVTVSGGGSPAATANDPTTIDYPIVAIIKTHVGNFVQGQQGAVFTFHVQNQGFGPTTGTITVTEVTPVGLTVASMSGTGWTCPTSPGNTCTRSDSLASAASYPDITATVNVASNAPSSLTNEADAVGGGSVGTAKGFDFVSIDTGRIVLGITKSHSGNFIQGQQNATYTVTVTNGGNLATSGTVTVTENAPTGLTLVSMSGTGWTCPSPGNTCTRSDALAPSTSYPGITVTVNVATNAPSSVTNQATATGGGDGTLHTANDPTTINPGPPVLVVTKTHNGNFSQGQTGAKYTVTLSNVGGLPTGGAVNVDELPPPGLAPVSMAGTGWNCQPAHCDRSDPLPSGSSYPPITVTVNVLATATSPQVNQVNVNGGGSPPVMATDSTTIIAAGVPNLVITKSHVGNFTQGQTGATYTLTVTNNIGAGTTVGTVSVNEIAPAGLTPVSMAGTGWICSAIHCTRSTALAAGASYPPITVTVNVLATATSPQVNQAQVSGGGSAPLTTSDPTVIQ